MSLRSAPPFWAARRVFAGIGEEKAERLLLFCVSRETYGAFAMIWGVDPCFFVVFLPLMAAVCVRLTVYLRFLHLCTMETAFSDKFLLSCTR